MADKRIATYAATLAVCSAASLAWSQTAGTVFTYQGQLKLSGVPADSLHDFEFSLWTDLRSTDPRDQIGLTLTLKEQPVADGLFTVPLDFGPGAFDGDARYLEIAVRRSGLGVVFETLTPRQVVTPTPYSIMALNAVGVDGHSLDAEDGDPRDAVFVDGDGNVGVGTTGPRATLDVNGSLSASAFKLTLTPTAGHVLTSDADGNGTWKAPPSGGGSLWLEHRDDIYYDAGKVGIGTDTPGAPLDVKGGIAVDGFQMGERVPSGYVLTADINGVGTWQPAPGGGITFWRDGPEDHIYYADGRVGIGTSGSQTPVQDLHVEGSTYIRDRLGIGMTSPSQPLDVTGNARIFNGNLHLGAEGFDPYIELMSDENSDATEMRIKSLDGVGFAVTNSANTPLFVVEQSGEVGIGTTTPSYPLHVVAATGTAVRAEITGGAGGRGVHGKTAATNGVGVFGEAPNGTGVEGYSYNSSRYAVYGFNEAESGDAIGVFGETNSPSGRGVYGKAMGTHGRGVFGEAATGYGVWGQSSAGTGVYGEATTTSGGKGVSGWIESSTGIGVLGQNDANTGDAIGVKGMSGSSQGFAGYFEGRGYFSGNLGIGTTSPTSKVHVTRDEMTARLGYSWGNIYGSYDSSLYGEFVGSDGDTAGGLGYRGDALGTVVHRGVWGRAASSDSTSYLTGVDGDARGGRLARGVIGYACDGAEGSYGVYGDTCSGEGNYAGYFEGDVKVTETLEVMIDLDVGNDLDVSNDAKVSGILSAEYITAGFVSKSGGSFKIDHPLDPQSKYLHHSFVESPDMMNVYNGNVVLDDKGQARVTMPDYFEALNRDFRYQLTAIGAPGPNLYIAEKISKNRFKIAGGKPGMEVSWQVTGIRQDDWANANRIQVETDKPESERGKYLHARAYCVPEKAEVDRDTMPGEGEDQ